MVVDVSPVTFRRTEGLLAGDARIGKRVIFLGGGILWCFGELGAEKEQTHGIKEPRNEAVTSGPRGDSPAVAGKLMLSRIKNYEPVPLL